MEKKKHPQFRFGLRKIVTEQFALIEDSYSENSKKVGIGTNLNFKADFDDRIIGVFAKFQFEADKNPFLIIEVSCYFQIHEDTWNAFYNQDSKSYTVPKNFISHLAMLTIGTVRGTLHAKTENTKFNRFILPTINVIDLIKQDIIFNIDPKN